MLHTETVEPHTLELLRLLMRLPELDGFLLVGGTSLSLQIGHRISVDIDMFSIEKFDSERLLDILREQFEVGISDKSIRTLNLRLNGVKTDMLHYPYPLLQPSLEVDGVRMISRHDICAMKLGAISGRAEKKDFYDLYFLLKEFQFSEMLDFYQTKYSTDDIFHILKSVAYFAEADESPEPNMLEKVSWMEVKRTIQREVRGYLK